MGKLTYYSAGGRVRRTIHTDPSNPWEFTQQTEQWYPDDFAQANRELGEHQQGHMKLVARGVPVAVYEQSVREEWDEKRWARWLNDPDNAAFRVWRGAV
jgi:hypothetical protein